MPDSITSFTLERSTDGSNWSQVSGSPLAGSARSYTDTTTGPSLYYRLTGHTSEGLDFLYNIVQVTSSGGWVKTLGGSGDDFGVAVAVDSSGNVVVCGLFSGSVTFGTVGGSPVTLNSAGGYDIFIAKYATGGALIWAKRYGSGLPESVKAISLDSNNNIYLGGGFSGTCNFGGSDLTSSGDTDPWLAKYDSSGNHVWSISFLKGIVSDSVNSIATDSAGNVYVTGSFRGGNFSNPLPINNGKALYSEFNSSDAFLIKFNSSGLCQWAKNFWNSGSLEVGNAVAVDSNDRVIVAGYFQGDINLGGNTLTSFGAFLGQFDSAGNHLWSRSCGDNNARALAIAIDSDDKIIVAGYFSGSSNFGGGTVNGTALSTDMFIAKYASDGSYFGGHITMGNQYGVVSGVATDSQHSVIITGYFRGNVDFGGVTLTSNPNADNGFVAKYYSPGDLAWVKAIIHSEPTRLNGVAVDSARNVILTGGYTGTPAFNGQTLTNSGGSDMLLAKLNP